MYRVTLDNRCFAAIRPGVPTQTEVEQAIAVLIRHGRHELRQIGCEASDGQAVAFDLGAYLNNRDMMHVASQVLCCANRSDLAEYIIKHG